MTILLGLFAENLNVSGQGLIWCCGYTMLLSTVLPSYYGCMALLAWKSLLFLRRLRSIGSDHIPLKMEKLNFLKSNEWGKYHDPTSARQKKGLEKVPLVSLEY